MVFSSLWCVRVEVHVRITECSEDDFTCPTLLLVPLHYRYSLFTRKHVHSLWVRAFMRSSFWHPSLILPNWTFENMRRHDCWCICRMLRVGFDCDSEECRTGSGMPHCRQPNAGNRKLRYVQYLRLSGLVVSCYAKVALFGEARTLVTILATHCVTVHSTYAFYIYASSRGWW